MGQLDRLIHEIFNVSPSRHGITNNFCEIHFFFATCIALQIVTRGTRNSHWTRRRGKIFHSFKISLKGFWFFVSAFFAGWKYQNKFVIGFIKRRKKKSKLEKKNFNESYDYKYSFYRGLSRFFFFRIVPKSLIRSYIRYLVNVFIFEEKSIRSMTVAYGSFFFFLS